MINQKDKIFAQGWNFFRDKVESSYYVRALRTCHPRELEDPFYQGASACLEDYQRTGETPPRMERVE